MDAAASVAADLASALSSCIALRTLTASQEVQARSRLKM
jgi:hypothetical protein